MAISESNIQFQKFILGVGVFLFALKITAWIITGSLAILSDALESTMNIISGTVGLYSLYIASKPKDADHPYGHGKVEFIAAGVEGALIFGAGVYIIIESILKFKNPTGVADLDLGIAFIGFSGLVNFLAGHLSEIRGKATNSMTLISGGKHLKSDAYTTLGLLLGLLIIYFTGLEWIDSIVAMIFASIIIYTGYRVMRKSVAGIMDETDLELLKRIIAVLEENRSDNWIDIHNFRVIKYGATYHIDCHLTVPWYFDVREAHIEVESLTDLIIRYYGAEVELFVHTDPCVPSSCSICSISECKVRQHKFEGRLKWDMGNVLSNKKHEG